MSILARLWFRCTLLEVASGVCWPHVVPRVGATLAERNDMLYSRGHDVWEAQTWVNRFLTDVANPVMKVEQGQVVNLVSLRVDCSTLR